MGASALMLSGETGDHSDFSSSEEDELNGTELTQTIQGTQGVLHIKDLIGRGAFGSVYRATWKGLPAAVKVIEHDDEETHASFSPLSTGASLRSFSGTPLAAHGSDAFSPPSLDILDYSQEGQPCRVQTCIVTSSLAATRGSQAMLEAAVSSAVCHPNIVQTYDYQVVDMFKSATVLRTEANRETRIIMEFCDAGSLDEAIQHGKFHGGVTEGLRHMRVILRAVCLTLLDIASAMTHLHSMRIVHKDLKPKNVLLSSCPEDPRGFTAKVSDFGLSQLQPDKTPSTGATPAAAAEPAGTVAYMAPEMLCYGSCSPACDVYAFGVLVWELYMGEPLYEQLSKVQIMFGVMSQDLRPQFPPSTPAWLADLACQCWAANPAARPSFANVRSTLLTRL
ncbi:g8436 [Coccomyxa viridis]|uniref:G8436 protein n=1 Tax=Coccomyxa viridis TaxID=1274662 RepID=A0ABP1G0I2_9CHLO